jgi:hypothetical protein
MIISNLVGSWWSRCSRFRVDCVSAVEIWTKLIKGTEGLEDNERAEERRQRFDKSLKVEINKCYAEIEGGRDF